MKKIALILAGLMASGASVAATYTQNLNSGANDVLMTDCSLLANDIEIVLTQNVTGGLACNDTDSIVAVSVCHTKGLKAERSSVVTTDASGATICTVTADEACVVTVSGSSFPSVSTETGTVTQIFPEVNCAQGATVTQATTLATP